MKRTLYTLLEKDYNPLMTGLSQMKIGDKFTIEGVTLKSNGKFSTRCKPGNETILIVKTIFPGEPKKKPSIII